MAKRFVDVKKTIIVHKLDTGDRVMARQDTRDHSIWYLEFYNHGEQTNSLRLKVTAEVANGVVNLVKKKAQATKLFVANGNKCGRNKYTSAEMPIYTITRRR